MSESRYYSLHNLLHNMFVFQSRLWCCDNHERPAAQARRCFQMKSCQIVFDAPLCGWEPARLLRCPPGAGEQSGFGISHSLSSQGLWPSAVSTANCSLTYPRPCCLANYEYSAAVKVILSDMQLSSRIVSAVLFGAFWREDLTRTWPFYSFTSRFAHVWWQQSDHKMT